MRSRVKCLVALMVSAAVCGAEDMPFIKPSSGSAERPAAATAVSAQASTYDSRTVTQGVSNAYRTFKSDEARGVVLILR